MKKRKYKKLPKKIRKKTSMQFVDWAGTTAGHKWAGFSY